MKRILFFISGLVLMASCQHDVVYDVDYNITLDKANTYYAGEPVRFNLAGEVDNVIFYSGETGHQYVYRNRYEVPLEDVKSANLHLEITARNGATNADALGALEIWVSKDFAGINGVDDGVGDRAVISKMVEDDMPGWVKVDYEDLKANDSKKITLNVPVSDYLENLSIAFHWCPKRNDIVQRTYWIDGKVIVDLEGTPEPTEMTLSELDMKSVMMNEQVDPYYKNNENGTIRFDNKTAGEICFQGVGANALEYAIDGWVFTTPQTLNKVSNDTPQFVKNLQNYCQPFEHVYEKPGTYKVTFVGRNENYASASEQIKEFTINILEKPDLQ